MGPRGTPDVIPRRANSQHDALSSSSRQPTNSRSTLGAIPRRSTGRCGTPGTISRRTTDQAHHAEQPFSALSQPARYTEHDSPARRQPRRHTERFFSASTWRTGASGTISRHGAGRGAAPAGASWHNTAPAPSQPARRPNNGGDFPAARPPPSATMATGHSIQEKGPHETSTSPSMNLRRAPAACPPTQHARKERT